MRNRQPDVIFIDLPDPPQEILAFIASVKQADANTRVAVLSHGDAVDLETRALESGADAFIAKGQGSSLALIDLIHDLIRR
jgi:DNA-binding NarL/FixJ family response regulator